MITGFHIYINKIAFPDLKVGEIVSIDNLITMSFKVINHQNNYKVFMDNNNSDDCYGIITEVIERDSDDNYYIEGNLLNFSVEEREVSIIRMGPYTSTQGFGSQGVLVYGSESGTPALFKRISKPNVRKLKLEYPSWFV